MGLDNLQRITVETIRGNRSFTRLEVGEAGDGSYLALTLMPDSILSHDIALAVQAYYNRQNKKLKR